MRSAALELKSEPYELGVHKSWNVVKVAGKVAHLPISKATPQPLSVLPFPLASLLLLPSVINMQKACKVSGRLILQDLGLHYAGQQG